MGREIGVGVKLGVAVGGTGVAVGTIAICAGLGGTVVGVDLKLLHTSSHPENAPGPFLQLATH